MPDVPQDPNENPFVGWTTIEEASKFVGRKSSTIRTWADAGKIRAYSLSQKARVVNIEEVREYAETARLFLNRKRPEKPNSDN